MPHPSQLAPHHSPELTRQQRHAPLSELMRAKNAAGVGGQVNFCPFGCEDEQLDQHGYCRHLVGFSVGDPVHPVQFEPMIHLRRGRVVYVERATTKAEHDEEGKAIIVHGKPKLQPIQKGDRLVRITTSCRVYRDVPETAKSES